MQLAEEGRGSRELIEVRPLQLTAALIGLT